MDTTNTSRNISEAQLRNASVPADDLDALLGADAPVALEDRGASTRRLRGAGARSPLFWKLILVTMACMWGFSFFVMKDALDLLPTFYLLACRFLFAALIMLVLFAKRIRVHFNKRNLAVGALMGVLMGTAYGLQTLGLGETTAGKNAFLTGTYCILVPFISHFMSGEPLTRFNVGAALLCLGGIGLVALDDFTMNIGDALTLAGALFFALQMAVVSRFGRDLDINVITFWMFLTVGTMCAAISFVTEVPPAASVWTPSLLGVLAFLSVFCTCVGMLLQNIALVHVPPSIGSLLLSLESPSGVLFSVIFANELLSGRLVAGFALIFVSIVLSETHFSFLRPLLQRR
ncbi:DMT family transporter [Collinsella tanakaei]|uniref:DMT family transporter n=1 Tax=Collinsella tanakaei TaxID=626935 RepID=UPI00195B7908|nr:DMT family transporter [Collinsella tanakaei]MBM6779329.1 DMT family transporter [Collinsella tanakaei]